MGLPHRTIVYSGLECFFFFCSLELATFLTNICYPVMILNQLNFLQENESIVGKKK